MSTPPSATTASLGPVMLDVEGTALTDADRLRISHPATGGVILFSRNFESRAQLTALTADIHAQRQGVLIAVDHEGGRVQRFKQDGFTVLPPAAALGRLWDRDESASRLLAVKAATAFGFVLASELRACGVDFSFTPVLDLAWGRSGVIGDRALHADPRVVTLLAKSLVHGLTLAGMAACGKHFPGHGHVEADSHFAVPVDERPLETILAEDAAPYAWFGLGLPAVMPAHVIYARVDDKPAGFSAIWLQQILRNRLGYMGAILSDDLAMKGAAPAGDVVAGGKAALKAGCDMVLVCNKPDWAEQLLKGIDATVSPASQARLAALQPMFAAPDWESLHASDRFAAAFRVLKGL